MFELKRFAPALPAALLVVFTGACGHSLVPDGGSGDGGLPDASANAGDGGSPGGYVLTVTTPQLSARQHVGATGESTLAWELRAPADLHGGGLPPDLTSGMADLSVVQLELPQGGGSTDENAMSSTGLVDFQGPLFCLVGVPCGVAGQDGSWKATVTGQGGKVREVQLALAMRDVIAAGRVYVPVMGVFLAATDAIQQGEKLRLEYTGRITGRATDWTEQPFLAHFRYRSWNGVTAGAWTVLDDAQVQPLQITAETQPKYVRALAPLDVAVGQPFTVVVVLTDHYGNPRPYTGSVKLTGGVTAELQLNNEWRKELPGVVYSLPGAHKIVPEVSGVRSLYHYTMATAGAPPIVRLLGDLHSHSGDGGAQRKFLGAFIAGDHKALYARTHDAFRYMHEAAGLDFGVVSEHAVRWDAYTPLPAVAADKQFQTGGPCAGAGAPIPSVGDWWTRQQQIVEQYNTDAKGAFIAFPAFEWHATHTTMTDKSPLHRIVLYRDFAPDAAHPLPLLPGDNENISPQCVIRFLSLAGYTPDKALVIPHMMLASPKNIDWELTYADTSVAPKRQIESYFRIGEIYSARAIDQRRAYGSATLTVFEVADALPATWSYRHGWRDLGAHIGVIGSSDNHEQMPGVNDDVDLDGVNYHSNEPGGYAAVLATTRDRGGIYGALGSRHTYATSGIRAWLDYTVDGMPMGSQIARSAAQVNANLAVMAGMSISTVEVFASKVGATGPFQVVQTANPGMETYSATVPLPNPVTAGAPAEEWLYYVRAFFKAPNSTNDADEAVWSSPVWITWSH